MRDKIAHGHAAYLIEHNVEAMLCMPRLSEEPIERSALLQKLVESPHTPLVLISAPVGYGKSTLLAQWSSCKWSTSLRDTSAVRDRPFATVDLESDDNNPFSFLTTIIRSVERACPDIDSISLERFSESPQSNIIKVLLPALIDEIIANCPHVILALDNYQEITEPECHEQITYLLNHLSPHACLALVTRTDPPLPLARLRACGDILEIRTDELHFTRDEIARLVRRFGGHQLDESDLDNLFERTEGWPSMVCLAARLLRNQPDPARFLRSFGGNHRHVVDYLEEEILRHLPGEVQRFLARTSILNRFTAPLCAAVARTTNSADLLNGLERSNLCLVPLDGVRTWYRYHNLFRQTLREQLARSEPEIGADLHQKASAWYERNGHTGDAIEHALAASASDRAIELIARHWSNYIYQGKLTTIRNWLDVLGEELTSRSPLTAICAAWVAALSGDRLGGCRWLEIAERLGHRGPLPNGMQSILGTIALYQGTFGFDGLAKMLTAAHTAADLHSDPISSHRSPWYAQARVALGYSRYLAGDSRAAVRPLERAVETATAFPVLRILALSALSLVTGDLGRAAQAADLATAAQELVVGSGLNESSEVSLAQVAQAAALVRKGQLLRARHELEHAVRLRRTIIGLPPWPTITALVLLTRVVLIMGDRDDARALLNETTDLLDTVPDGGGQAKTALSEIERRLADAEYSGTAARLTDREEAVLRLLQGSLPLRDVAAQLFVTVNTVKSHTRLIYRKLGVSSRSEAIRRARDLGLL